MTDTKNSGSVPIDFLFRHVFKLDPDDVRQALGSIWRTWLGLREDGDMPRNDPAASNMQRFELTPDFQERFDRWKAEVESAQNGTLEITHEEPIVAGGTTTGFMIFWRIAHRPHIAGRR